MQITWIKKAYDFTLESPAARTFFSIIIPILVGVFSGVFVAEITVPEKGISWPLFYKAKSFYMLLVILLVTYVYNIAIYKHDKGIMSFSDADYCRAYMRSKCLPEAAERYRDLIRSGESGELEKVMDEVDRILK